jgi:tetratricopeptide (TPR) repeat protein
MTDESGRNTDQQEPQSWLRRQLQRSRAPKNGDTIAAQIGEDARNVVVGKNVIQIGEFVLPIRLILALLLVVVAGLVAAWLYFVPAQMQGSYNLAIAEFGERQTADKLERLPDGSLLSGWVYTKLNEQYVANQGLLGDITVELWHDSLPLTQKRSQIGIVENEAGAKALAQKINAHIIIYGEYDPAQGLVVKLYANHELLRGDLDEASGNYQLGDAIPLQLPLNRADLGQTGYINGEMTRRANAIFWLTLALAYEIQNKPQKAFDLLKEHIPTTELPGGQRLFHFFMGREALILSDQAQDPNAQECSDVVYKYLATARDEFTQASDKAYIRPLIGLGGVYFDYAQCLPPEARFESDALSSALANYTQALQLAEEQKEPELVSRAQLGLGQVYQIQGDAFADNQQIEEAKHAYAQALTWLNATIEALKPLQQYRLLTHTYLTRGIVYEHQAEIATEATARHDLYSKALADYADCTKQSGALSTDIVLLSTAKLCQSYAKQVPSSE